MTTGPDDPSPWEVPPPQYPAPPGSWGPPPPQPGREGMAVAALIFGILPVFAGLLGIGLGIGALGRIKRSGRAGRGMAIAGIVLASLWLVLLVTFIVTRWTVT